MIPLQLFPIFLQAPQVESKINLLHEYSNYVSSQRDDVPITIMLDTGTSTAIDLLTTLTRARPRKKILTERSFVGFDSNEGSD